MTDTPGLVATPENAELRLDASLMDGADQTAALAMTVHVVNGQSVVNFWECARGRWRRLLLEFSIGELPSREMFLGLILRAGAKPELRAHLTSDLHYTLAMQTFRGALDDLFN